MSRVGTRLRSLAVDLAPLRVRDYRLLWLGELVSETGSNITLVAVYIQIYRLTRSAAAVGAIGLAQVAPLMLSALLGGPIVDRHDRRRLLFVSQAAQAGGSAVLLGGALTGRPPVALVYAAAGLVAGLSGFSLATRSAMTPNLVPTDRLSSALALNQVMWNTCLVVGPALGGVIVGSAGLSWAYGVDVVSFGATIGAATLMSPQPPRPEAARPSEGWRSVVEGFAYLRGRPVLQSTFVVDLVAMVFGMPRALFPVIAVSQLHGGPEVVGVLFSAVSVGALGGALTTGWVRRVTRQGLAILLAVAVWGAAIVAFGLSGDSLALAIGCLALAGAADVVSAVFRSTILQATVPDVLRGRLSGIHILVVAGGPRLGDFEAGGVAALTTPTVSVVSGGLLCLVGVGVLALSVPAFARYRAGEPA